MAAIFKQPNQGYLRKTRPMNEFIVTTGTPQFVIKTTSPCIVCKVVSFKDSTEMQDFIAKHKAMDNFLGAQVAGYSILLVVYSELPTDKAKTLLSPDSPVFNHAAAAFLEYIVNKPHPHRAYKI